jgi:hypothetical protein
MSRITKDLEAFVAVEPATWPGWIPLIVLPAAACLGGANEPRWCWMWMLAFSLWLGCKWLTWWEEGSSVKTTALRQWGYMLAWPGMNAGEFLDSEVTCRRPTTAEWSFAIGKIFLGVVVVWGVARIIPAGNELLTGWVGLVGLAFVLNFGLFHLVALLWRRANVNAVPIMRAPVLATSISEFWNRRWNVAFNHLVFQFVFRPLARVTNLPAACLGAFLVSGLMHELVISVPAGGGYGLPMCYFLLQGCAVLLERSRAGRRLGLRGGWRGWAFTVVIAAGPAFWVFHPPFIKNVVLPMLTAIGATERNI